MIQKKADIKDGVRLYIFLHHHRTAQYVRAQDG